MATLNVGQLVARLVLDTSGFTSGTRSAVTAAQSMQSQMTGAAKATSGLQVVTHGYTQTSQQAAQATQAAAKAAATGTQAVGGMSDAWRQSRFDIQFAALALGAITGALIAAGKEAISASVKFEGAMAKIVGLTGKSKKQVGEWRKELLKIGPELGRGPQELGEALYFVASSGVPTAQAMDVVKISAKAATAGLGETQVIAKTVAAALAAYRTSGLDAAKATDVLVATVKFGTGEAADLAGALGRILPVSSALGVEFNEVGAALAAMTQTGLSTDEAVTALRNVFQAFLKPGKEAQKLLASVGSSGEELRDILAKDGVLGLFQKIEEITQGNTEAFGKLIPNIRGVVGALSLTGENADVVKKIFEDMADVTGLTDEAFKAASETIGFKFQQAMANIQTAMISIGDVLAPFMEKLISPLAKMVTTLGSAFGSLPGPLKEVVVAFAAAGVAATAALTAYGLFLAIQGPLTAKLATTGQSLGMMMGKWAALAAVALIVIQNWDRIKAGFNALPGPIKVVASAVGVLVGSIVLMNATTKGVLLLQTALKGLAVAGAAKAAGGVGGLMSGLGGLTPAIAGVAGALAALVPWVMILAEKGDLEEDEMNKLVRTYGDFTEAMKQTGTEREKLIATTVAAGLADQQATEALNKTGVSLLDFIHTASAGTDGARKLSLQFWDMAAAGKITTKEAGILETAAAELSQELGADASKAQAMASALAAVEKAAKRTAVEIMNMLLEYSEAHGKLLEADHDLANASHDLTKAQAEYNKVADKTKYLAEDVAKAQKTLDDATKDLTKATKAQTEAQEELDKLLEPATEREIAEAVMAHAEALRNVTRANLDYLDALDKVTQAGKKVDEVNATITKLTTDQIKNAQDMQDALDGIKGDLTDFAKGLQSAFEDILDPMEKYGAANDKTNDSLRKSAQLQADYAKALRRFGKDSDEARKALEAMREAEAKAGETTDKTTMSLSNLKDNLKSNLKFLQDWKASLEAIAAKAGPEVAQAFAALGPEAAGLVADAAKLSAGELSEFGSLFAETNAAKSVKGVTTLARALGDTGISLEYINKLQEDGETITKDLADAQIDLTQAVRDEERAVLDAASALDAIATANYSVMDASMAVNLVTNKGTIITDELKAATEKLATAKADVAAATTAVTTAEEALIKTRIGEPKYTEDLYAATKNLADAKWSLQQATQKRAEAAQAEADALAALNGQLPNEEEKTRKVLEHLLSINALPASLAKDLNIKLTGDPKHDLDLIIAALQKISDTKWTINMTSQIGGAAPVGAQTGGLLMMPFMPSALGGPVKKGDPHWVGEKGPEPFFPETNGRILSNREAKAAMGGGGTSIGGGGGGDTYITLTIPGFMGTKRELVAALHEGFLEKQRKGGTLKFDNG